MLKKSTLLLALCGLTLGAAPVPTELVTSTGPQPIEAVSDPFVCPICGGGFDDLLLAVELVIDVPVRAAVRALR